MLLSMAMDQYSRYSCESETRKVNCFESCTFAHLYQPSNPYFTIIVIQNKLIGIGLHVLYTNEAEEMGKCFELASCGQLNSSNGSMNNGMRIDIDRMKPMVLMVLIFRHFRWLLSSKKW